MDLIMAMTNLSQTISQIQETIFLLILNILY